MIILKPPPTSANVEVRCWRHSATWGDRTFLSSADLVRCPSGRQAISRATQDESLSIPESSTTLAEANSDKGGEDSAGDAVGAFLNCILRDVERKEDAKENGKDNNDDKGNVNLNGGDLGQDRDANMDEC